MVIKEIKLDFKKQKEINILPIGDIHFNSEMFDEHRFNEWVYVFKHTKNPFCAIVGDITDEDRPSMRLRRQEMFYDRIEAYRAEDKQHLDFMDKYVIPKLSFLNKDNCIGLLDGDHYRLYSNGLTSTQYICSKLNLTYLRDGQAIVSVKYFSGHGTKTTPRGSYNIILKHGCGFSRTNGKILNYLIDFAKQYANIDCVISGHRHQCVNGFLILRKFNPAVLTIRKKEVLIVNTGSFRNSFSYNFTDYAEKKEYPENNGKQACINVKFIRHLNENEAKVKCITF